MKISVVSFIVSKAFDTPLNNFKNVICEISDEVCFITGNIKGYQPTINKDKKIKTKSFTFQKTDNFFSQSLNYLKLQLNISKKILKQSKTSDCFIFFMEGVGILPMFFARLTGKKIIYAIDPSMISGIKVVDNDVEYEISLDQIFQNLIAHVSNID